MNRENVIKKSNIFFIKYSKNLIDMCIYRTFFKGTITYLRQTNVVLMEMFRI